MKYTYRASPVVIAYLKGNYIPVRTILQKDRLHPQFAPYHTAQETGETLTLRQIVSGSYWTKSVNTYIVPNF